MNVGKTTRCRFCTAEVEARKVGDTYRLFNHDGSKHECKVDSPCVTTHMEGERRLREPSRSAVGTLDAKAQGSPASYWRDGAHQSKETGQ
jgi:hypothetical protein